MTTGEAAQAKALEHGNRELTRGIRDPAAGTFQAGIEAFRFQSVGKREVEKWSAAINQAVTGNETAPPSTGFALSGAALVADTLHGTFDQFRTSFGGDKAPAAAKQPAAERERSAGPCPSCGASISGLSGATATCEYGDTETRLA